MSEQSFNGTGDDKLGVLLRAARPMANLPPGFERRVWQRIEKGEVRSGGLLEWLAGWLITPRIATAGLALVILVGAGAGVARGIRAGEQEARDRYIASVDPAYRHR